MTDPREGYVPAGDARLYLLDIGEGTPIIVVHGGPEFDHTYLRPELDRLAGSSRLEHRRRRPRGDAVRMQEILSSAGYQRGSLDAEADYYRIHFRLAVRRPEDLERIVGRLRSHFTDASVRKARAIEQRLFDETLLSGGYDLFPKLPDLDLPTLVVHGEQDFIPVELAAPIARAIPGARLAVLPACGHFAYLEWPDLVHEQIAALIRPP